MKKNLSDIRSDAAAKRAAYNIPAPLKKITIFGAWLIGIGAITIGLVAIVTLIFK